MRDLALSSQVSLLEDIAQAIAQNSGDKDFDALMGTRGPTSNELDLGHLFDEAVKFGDAQICPHVLIFDGWDEISVSASEGFRKQIEETLGGIRQTIVAGARHRVRVILTGRPSLDVTESRFLLQETPVLTVRPFTRIQLTGFADTLLSYAVNTALGEKQVLRRRIEVLLKQIDPDTEADDGPVQNILGLPLLALLAIWMSLNDTAPQEALSTDLVTVYRRLVDMTCMYGGGVERAPYAARFVGDDLRELLRRTAAAMTMRGDEYISYTELERRLKDAGMQANEAIGNPMKANPVAGLMISFFFNTGTREHGCEFAHKSFREYLFAEAVVATLKELGDVASGLSPRARSWADFPDGDPRRTAIRRLAPLLAPRWITPEVGRNINQLLAWEIGRATTDDARADVPLGTPAPIRIERWHGIRDTLAALWDWWVEGVHLRPQPFIREDTATLDYKEPYAVRLAKILAPTDLPRDKLPEPVRIDTLDAHLGDALFRLNCVVHFQINKRMGWLDRKWQRGQSPSLPQQLWEGAVASAGYTYQTRIKQNDREWVAFAPSTPDQVSHFFVMFCNRINGAGWRPAGGFPGGVDMRGIDLASVVIPLKGDLVTAPVLLRYARLSHAQLNQAILQEKSDLSIIMAPNLNGELSAGFQTNFSDAELQHASFGGAAFFLADFSGANLTQAGFESAQLRRAEFKDSNVKAAKFVQATFQDVERSALEGANLDGAIFN